jgi:hypothetical protein
VSSGTVTVVAAMVSSAPAWLGLYVTNRRAISRQTQEFHAATAAQTAEFKQTTADQTDQLKAELGGPRQSPADPERTTPWPSSDQTSPASRLE